MNIGARIAFDRMEDLDVHLAGVDFGVELALPFRVSLFAEVADRIGIVRDLVDRRGVKVHSLHAPQGDLSRADCWDWLRPVMDLARDLAVDYVVIHPAKAKIGRANRQHCVIENLKILQQKYRKIVVAIETFSEPRRTLLPEEVVALGLPMVLDTSHLLDDARVFGLLERNCDGIVGVHLSSRGHGKVHQPIDDFCFDVVKRLAAADWRGSVILEYMPEFGADRLGEDIRRLQRFIAQQI